MDKEKTTRQRLAEWSKTPEGRESYEKVAEEMRREISEKPMNQDEFNTELKRVTDDKVYEYYPEQDGDFITEIDFAKCIRDVARHFAQWQKEQMMKEAVEGRVISNDGISFPVSNEIHRLRLIEGDKVRIIVIPNTDEK